MTVQRNINDIDKTILDNFYKLVHTQPTIRLRAATSTYKILEAFEKRNNPKFNDNLNYCIERLVAGLSSSRALARQGYAVLLLELLRGHKLTTERLLAIAQQKFGQVTKDTSKDELLGYFILISLILESGNLQKSKANTLFTEKIYKHLTMIHKTKSYFDRPVCDCYIKYLDLFYPHMLANLPRHVFEDNAKITQLELLTLCLCNQKQPIKEFITTDAGRIERLFSLLRTDNLRRLPVHPLLNVLGNTIINHFPNHFQTFYLEVLDSKVETLKEMVMQCNEKNNLSKYIDQMMNLYGTLSNDSDKIVIAQQLAYAVRRPILVDDSPATMNVLKFLMINSLFKWKPSTKNDVTLSTILDTTPIPNSANQNRRVREAVRFAFHSVLDCFVSTTDPLQRVERFDELLLFVNEIISSESCKNFGANYEKQDVTTQVNLWKNFFSLWLKHKALLKSEENSKNLYSIASLYCLYGIEILEHGLECQKQLEELAESSKEVIGGDPVDGSWADILTDQIIAILSATECDPWIRRLCQSVFGSLLAHISQTSIDVLCEALAASPEEDDDEGDEGDEDEDEMEGEDGKKKAAKKLHNHKHDEGQIETDDDDSVSSESMEVDHDNISKQRQKDHNEEEEDEDDEYLDDDQMMKLDGAIADMFRLKRMDKKKDSNNIAFKLRLLDLVKRILVKRNKDQETINLLLGAIIPLARSSKSIKEARPIWTKVRGILEKMPSKSRYPKVARFLATN